MCGESGCSLNLGVDDASCEKSRFSIFSRLKDEVKPDMEKATTADAYRETIRKYAAWATQENADVGPCTGLAIGRDNECAQEKNA